MLRDTENVTHTSAVEISSIFGDFYKNLYSSTNPTEATITQYLRSNPSIKMLGNDHKHLLDRPITLQQTLGAIKRLKSNKAPGPGRYTAEFCNKFASFLARYLYGYS